MKAAGQLVTGVAGATGQAVSGVTGAAGTVVTGVGGMVSTGGTATMQAAGTVVSGVGGMVSTGGTATMQAAGQVVKGVGGVFSAVSGIFDGGKKDRERNRLAAEKLHHEEMVRKAGEAKFDQRPVQAPSTPQVPDCFRCGSSTRMTFCGHFFCPNCHVNEGRVQCPVCQKIF